MTVSREIANNDFDSFAAKIKHLLKFAERKDGKWHFRFAAHSRFAYWAYNLLLRRRILSTGNMYLKRNPDEIVFSIDHLQEMLNSSSSMNTLMSKLFYFGNNITGTNCYWNKARKDLEAIITQEGCPTIFFTLSMAEYHWPDFLKIFSGHAKSNKEIQNIILNNPHLVDWYTERTEKFIKIWLYEYLKADWHWYQFEYASRGSIHCHGLAKLKTDPDLIALTGVALRGYLCEAEKSNNVDLSAEEVEQLYIEIREGHLASKSVCDYVDSLLTTLNPVESLIWEKPKRHVCKDEIDDVIKNDKLGSDYINLVNSVQKHVCSTAYCLRKLDDKMVCRFHFPYENSEKTKLQFNKINSKDGSIKYSAEIITKRNDPRLNRHQQVQLQG